jgi:hypothetical protein
LVLQLLESFTTVRAVKLAWRQFDVAFFENISKPLHVPLANAASEAYESDTNRADFKEDHSETISLASSASNIVKNAERIIETSNVIEDGADAAHFAPPTGFTLEANIRFDPVFAPGPGRMLGDVHNGKVTKAPYRTNART